MRKLLVILALVAVSVLMLATVSAQTASCVTPKQSGVNLRGLHEQNAPRVGRLAFGSQLQIIRKFNRWYEVQHNGGSAWVADWVVNEVACAGAAGSQPVSQPVQSQPAQPAMQDAPAQESAAIDNCCFVDRQCNTDQEWTDGYWAFQNNQCNAPSQSSSQPAYDISSPSEKTFHEILGAETLTTHSVLLTTGSWDVKLITAAVAIVNISSVDMPGCLSHSVSRVSGWATGWQWVDALAWKSHNAAGDDNEANGQITVHRDCNVSFYVWAPRHAWSLKLTKT